MFTAAKAHPNIYLYFFINSYNINVINDPNQGSDPSLDS